MPWQGHILNFYQPRFFQLINISLYRAAITMQSLRKLSDRSSTLPHFSEQRQFCGRDQARHVFRIFKGDYVFSRNGPALISKFGDKLPALEKVRRPLNLDHSSHFLPFLPNAVQSASKRSSMSSKHITPAGTRQADIAAEAITTFGYPNPGLEARVNMYRC